MQNYKLTIEYDGTRYNGWQRLKGNDNTIQSKLETVLSRMTGKEVQVTGAGRTDAGVHARGQVANVFLDTELREAEIREYMNRYLPEDIRIIEVKKAEERFHSRFCAKEKLYCYYISTGEKPSVFDRKYVYHIGYMPNLERMREAASFLTGKHDFKSFCGNKHMKKSSVRDVHSIDIDFDEKNGIIKISYRGDGFLQYMIRIITGTLLETGSGRREPSDMEAVLSALDREKAGYTTPPQGLFLEGVYY